MSLTSADYTATITEQAMEIARLRDLLGRVLGTFTERGYPGAPCHRSGWVDDARLAEWREQVRLS